MSRPIVPHRGEAGIALVETLIAIAIIAGMTAVTFDMMRSDAQIQRDVRTRREATLLAQSLLARAESSEELTDGRWHDLAWHVTRTPYAAPGSSPVPLERLGAFVTDPRSGRQIAALRTLRMAR